MALGYYFILIEEPLLVLWWGAESANVGEWKPNRRALEFNSFANEPRRERKDDKNL